MIAPDHTGVVWLNDRGDVAAEQPPEVERLARAWLLAREPELASSPELAELVRRTITGVERHVGPEMNWFFELLDGRLAAAWVEVELRVDLRYVHPLQRRAGALVPAPESEAEWITDPPARGLGLPELEPREARPASPTHEERRSVGLDALLSRLRDVFADLDMRYKRPSGESLVTPGNELAELLRRSGVSVPRSARGRWPKIDLDRARALRADGMSMEAVAHELGVGVRALYRQLRGEL